MKIAHSIPELIGNTPLLRLERFAPGGGILGKLESFNPLSSAKDRAGLYMIRAAEEAGLDHIQSRTVLGGGQGIEAL